MILFSLEEFAAKRRVAQKELEDALRASVRQALDSTLDTAGFHELLNLVMRLYRSTYFTESGTRTRSLPKGWRRELLATLRKVKPPRDEASVDRITVFLATSILSRVSIEASLADSEDLFLEWVTMEDEHVRPTHRDADGQVRPIGEKYSVGGAEMRFPGDPTVAIELWINCRCALRPTLASEAVTAGGTMTNTNTVTWTPKAAPVEAPVDAEEPDGDEAPVDDNAPTMLSQVPWHGVLAPEGVPSGDGRMFAPDSLRNRDLPLPLTWQKSSGDGHSGSVTVAKIEKIERLDGMIRASGHFLSTPEADEVIGLLADFGKFGVSVDADDATMEIDEAEEMVVFTSARIASASIVAIPAFAEAYVSIGTWDEADNTDPVDDALVAGATFGRGPGWVTNPVATKRIHDYWTRPGEPGFAKIAWGTEGDFERCRVELGEEIGENSPDALRFLNAICAQWQHDAIGIWPGKGEKAAADVLESTEPAEALNLVAAIGHSAPVEWFQNPNLTELTPLTVEDDGRVFGHLAGWETCHIGMKDTCTAPPPSPSAYAYFLTGQVALADGTRTPVGPITIGGGHANPRAGLRAAVEHYDSTSSVVADVTMGEDDHGIWFSGWVRPGATQDMVTALRASALSGDWRRVGDHLELVAALAVNTPGFPVPRTQIAASAQGQLSLVASGVVPPSIGLNEDAKQPSDVQAIIAAVAREVRAQEKRSEKMAALAARLKVGQ